MGSATKGLLRPSRELIPPRRFKVRRRLVLVMLSDDGHQVGEVDRRIEVEVRIHELSTKFVRELPVAVVLRCLFLDRAHDHGEELTPRESATSCLPEIVALTHRERSLNDTCTSRSPGLERS
jgi:hypothetical protein